MNPGDPIWYRHVSRGGYGYEQDVPGEFVRTSAKRVRVRVFRKSGPPVEISVAPANVRPRDPEAVWK